MPFFKYVAKNSFNDTIKGKVEARNIKQAAAILSNRQLLVITVTPLTDDTLSVIRGALFGVKRDDVVNFTRQLSTMIDAGLPLVNALSILVRQGSATFSRLLAQVQQDVEGGAPFAKALEKHPKVFSKIYTQLVFAGEAGGVLDDVLLRLAENLEKDKEFRAKTKSALIYPVIILIAMFVVGIVMMIFVIPQLTEMYADFGAELPTPTRLLIGISNFMVSFWWLMSLVIAGGIFLLRNYRRTEAGRFAMDTLVLRIPIFGTLIKKIILTEFTRTLSLLLGAGVSLIQALEIVTEGVENVVYKKSLREVTQFVEKGVSLSQALGRYENFPPILHQMVNVGEETGKLDEVLRKLSIYFESETEHAVKNMTTALEPMIMILLGIGVGAMVIAVIMPIYNLTSQF